MNGNFLCVFGSGLLEEIVRCIYFLTLKNDE